MKYSSLIILSLLFGPVKMFESELHEHGPSLRLPVKLQTTKTDYDSSGEPEFFQNPMNVAAAVKKVGPAVVRIDNTDSQGSGVIFSRDGKILTNAHVVKDCTTTIQVTLRDGQTFPAKVRGVDVVNDLAVLQLDTKATTKELPVAQLGNSDKLDVGDFVVAIGTPAGLGNTATMGIVSNLSRSSRELGYSAGQKGGDKTFNYIQTDAAINFGNSGGPLVNTRGEVVGINTSKFSRSEGIAFSIPTNAIKEILDDLCQGIVMKRPYLGVVMKPMTPKLAAAHNLDPNASMMCPEVNGAYVEVSERSFTPTTK